jgi:alkanesulfonate monooxygenase SsuD/methylene tetrahydromethanopterin reductase-like flavin-dependent oxidoreductase (luciferase family)
MSEPVLADFGFVAAAAGDQAVTDAQAFVDLLKDCELARELGYSTAWVIEHHFSDYFPMPDPIGLLQHIAARFPDLALGTCVVVTPWHHPLRLAGSICQLNNLTPSPLHLGLGRGTAKYEYDAFGIDMEETRARFQEGVEILQRALAGGRFSYRGKHYAVPREIEVRPRSDAAKIHLYGAVGNPASAQVMAGLGLPPICTAMGDTHAQKEMLDTWRRSYVAGGAHSSPRFPVMVNCIVESSDECALEAARIYMPKFMQAQVDHYTVDTTDWSNTKSYEAWSRIFAGLKARCNPDNIPPWARGQFIGSPQTVARRVAEFLECGFDKFIIHCSTPGVPAEVRRTWLRRFAQEVMPQFRVHAVARRPIA